jgi:hypothetical protein
MEKIQFWKNTSNYSITICAIAAIARMFFRKYLVTVIIPIMIVGVIALIVFVISEIMQFTLKQKQ